MERSGPSIWRPATANWSSETAAGVILALLIAAGFALRWFGISDPSLSHPEVFIPGTHLAPATNAPPPRFGFVENLVWHFHHEPHPIGYYIGMLAWTSVFGDSETSLRAPAAFFGAASIFVAYLLGGRLFGRNAGLAAAALIAFSGFHIFWSGAARMYAQGTFFALLATLLLAKIWSGGKPGRATSLGYVLSIAAAVHTTELNWAIYAGHVVWSALFSPPGVGAGGRDGPAHIVRLQTYAFMLSAPALLHAAYLARGDAASEPTIMFALHYLAFGVIFEPDTTSDPERFVGPLLVGAAAIASALLAAAGAVRATGVTAGRSESRSGPSTLVALAIASVALLQWMAAIAERRNAELAIIGTLPLLALVWPRLSLNVRAVAFDVWTNRMRRLPRLEPLAALLILLGVAAPAALILLSIWKPVTVFRAFIVFTPFYAILVGAGMASLLPRRALFAASAVAVGAFLTLSVIHERGKPASPRDYKGIAAAIAANWEDGDIVFIRRRSWMDAPVTYYLPHEAVYGGKYSERIQETGARRVWRVRWADHRDDEFDEEIAIALEDFRPCKSVTARRATATVFMKAGASDACNRVQ